MLTETSTFVYSPPLSRVTNMSKQMTELTNITQSFEIEDNPNFVHPGARWHYPVEFYLKREAQSVFKTAYGSQ